MTQKVEKSDFKPRQRAFLAAFAATASLTAAGKAAKVDVSTHYKWKDASKEYAAAFEEASRRAGDVLEDETVRRAHRGVVRPVLWQGRPQYEITKDANTGEIIGRKAIVIREYSDTLMVTLLKAWKPEKYRDRAELKVKGAVKMKFEGGLDELLALYRDLSNADRESVA